MQKKRQYILSLYTLLAVGALLTASSCKKTDIDFGDQYIDNQHTRVVMVDTITPQVSTVFVDSFPTVGTGVALVGTHSDPYFGKATASTYLEYAPPTGLTLDSRATFDSIILVLRYNKIYYGDTTKDIHLNVQELDQAIVPVSTGTTNVTSLFNTTSFTAKTPLLNRNGTTKTVRILPATTDTIALRLNDQLGITLFNLLKNNSENIQNSDAFINNVFKGIYVSSAATDELLIGLKDSISMRLYYTTPGLESKKEYTTFNLANTSHQFNHIDVDRANTPLGTAGFGRNRKQIASADLGNRAFMQYLTGALTKIQFPSIRSSLLNAPNYFSMLSASLSVKPVLGTYEGIYRALPVAIRASATDRDNYLGNDLIISSTSGSQLQTGNLFINNQEPKQTGYTYDVTSYISSQMNVITINENGLLLAPPSPNHLTRFDRLVIGDKNNANGQMKLTIYYLAIQ